MDWRPQSLSEAAVVKPLSHCGRYRIREAGIGDAYTVLSDLSHAEEEERVRLGVDLAPTYKEAAEGRTFAVVTTAFPHVTLVIFGVSLDGAIWLLPSQHCVEKHGRMLGSRRICRWFIEHAFSLVPRARVLFNGVTPEATSIIKWLKKCCGARFGMETFETETPTKAKAYPFFIERPANV